MNGRLSGTLLIVEDNDDDYLFTERAFKKAKFANPLVRVSDGQSALDFLYKAGDYADSPRPAMVLLDLNMPGVNGYTVLEKMKADETLRAIPVVVLTTSDDPRDIEKCYTLGANSYVHKPVDLPGFIEAIARLKDYWFEISLLPETQ